MPITAPRIARRIPRDSVGDRGGLVYPRLRNPFRIDIGGDDIPGVDSCADQPRAMLQNPVGIPAFRMVLSFVSFFEIDPH